MKSDQRVFCNTPLQNYRLKCEIGCMLINSIEIEVTKGECLG
jgi:hypothetical protein